jgi:glutamate-ammonia-ligase adenylyltransferase
MGYTGPDAAALSREFMEDLGRHAQAVHKIYRSLFEASRRRSDLEEIVLNSQLPESEALHRLGRRQVINPPMLLEGIRLLQEAPAFPLSPSRVRNLLANLVPALVEHLGGDAQPRLPITRFDRFCEALGSRASLYVEIVENPVFARGLFRILRSGDFLAEGLIRYPELLDTVFREDPPDRYLPALLSDPDVADGSTARRRDALRRFKQREEFKLGVRELEAPGSPQRRRLLSDLADACVQAAWRGMKRNFSHLDLGGAGLLALGKLGGRELSFHSDLDLVFLFDDSQGRRSAADFRDCLRFFREELQEYTAAGRAYEIDLRLRPEGRHTGEAVPLSQFIRYFQDRAEAWERLAYAKARLLVAEDFEFDPASLVFGRAWSDEDRRELRRIRRRKELELGREEELGEFDLKVGRGGLLDLQFVVQSLQVERYITEPNLLEANRLLGEISELAGVLPTARVQAHVEFFFALESCLYLMGLPPAKLSRAGTGLEAVSEALGEPNPAAVLERYRHQAELNRQLLDRVLGPEEEGP